MFTDFPTLDATTLKEIDEACAVDPVCRKVVAALTPAPSKKVAAAKPGAVVMPTTISGILTAVLPFFGVYGQVFMGLLPIIRQALAALEAAGQPAPTPAAVVAKMHEMTGAA